MDRQPNLQELENSRQELLEKASFARRRASGDLPPELAHLDQETFSLLLEKASPTGLLQADAEIQEFYTDFIERTQDGLRTCLVREIELLSLAVQSGDDQMSNVGFGMEQAAFPVKFRGKLVHVLLTGRFRSERLGAEDLHELARLTGQSPIEVQNAAGNLPVYSGGQLQVLLNLYRIMRDSIELALEEASHVSQARHQLLQSEKTRSLGTLSGGLAHHFNNLLSVVLGYSSFILGRGSHPPEIAEALKKIGEAAQKGRRLTQEILAFSGSEMETEKPCNVHDTLSSVLSLIESELGTATKVEKQLDAKVSTVTAPPSSIQHLVFNLLNNAIDSMPDGGLLKVRTSNTSIGSRDANGKSYLKIEVSDTGTPDGTSPADTQDLQLSNIYGAVGRLDGTVMVRPDKTGTCVEILLPVGEDVEEPAAPAPTTGQNLSPSSIWVVDDDPIFLEMCAQVLGEEGHDIVPLDGGDALKHAWAGKENPPDLVLMDFIMPECNGRELTEWLQEQGSEVPVILVSGFSENQPDIRQALQVKKTYFLQKPFTSRDLIDTITMAMGEKLIS